MAYNFLSLDRDQQFLMPPSVRDWLPEDHLAWFVLDVVGELDLTQFYERYRFDGRGGAAYEPAMMVALLVYAYCVGDRSSRRVEKRLVEDVAYRVVAANARPDHATVARFRADHETALAGLFAQVLTMCANAGMVRVGLVALDGTKIEASAAMSANMTSERLERALQDQARRIIEEAAAIDAAEDELYGEARGDELPPELADRSERLKRLRQAKAALDTAQAQRDARQADDDLRRKQRQAEGRKTPGRKPTKPAKQKPLLVNTTDPDSSLMKIQGGFAQAYNAQAVVTEYQVVVAAELTNKGFDVDQLEPMLAAAQTNVEAAGIDDTIGVLVADAGYYSTDNATLETDTELLIATRKAHKLPLVAEPIVDPVVEFAQQELERAKVLAALLESEAADEITMRDFADEVDLSAQRSYELRDAYRRGGVEALVRQRKPHGQRRGPPLAMRTRTRLEMEARLASDDGRALYKRRSEIVEPVFGQIKDPRGIRRFQRRGLEACASEWKFIAATHNLLKLWRQRNASIAAAAS